MKKIKHFLGWLFGYCPYGKGCPPEKPFTKNDVPVYHVKSGKITKLGDRFGGGGC